MNSPDWILLDVKVSGLPSAVFVVELAAQRMSGWKLQGEVFRKLLNQEQDITEAISSGHGLTREILERDGDPPQSVYREFTQYVGILPLVTFNLERDLEEVLWSEWQRWGTPAFGNRGFPALRLTQRLLDPIPTSTCKLQTLQHYYRLPARETKSALGSVQTLADLFEQVLQPIAQHRGLNSWEKVVDFAGEEWFPSRIAFGKYKGRLFLEARKDNELRAWLDWLAKSSNTHNAQMGRWYLRQLEITGAQSDSMLFAAPEIKHESKRGGEAQTSVASLVIHIDPELENLRHLVADARARLADLEATFTREKSRVDVMQAVLFRKLREFYQKRDHLRLIVNYRRKFLESLVRGGEEEAAQAQTHYKQARAQTDKDYDETAAAVADKKQLTAEEEAELSRLWKKLVKLYHPDRFANEPDKLETYHKLTAAINRAKDEGDFATLREIAEDPHGFILRQGWVTLDFSDEAELSQLRKLYETLQLEIITVLESLNRLRESSDYELCQLSEKQPSLLDELIAQRKILLEKETEVLETQADKLGAEIKELTGDSTSPIV